MGKEYDGDFDESTKYWIFDNGYVDGDVKVREHWYITGKYRGSVHRDCNIKVKLNHKIPIALHNLRNYDSHLIIKEPGKFNLSQANVIPNRLGKCTNNINKSIFIFSFQCLSSSLDSLVNLGKDDFKYLKQECDSTISDLVKQKDLIPMSRLVVLKSSKKKYLPKKIL